MSYKNFLADDVEKLDKLNRVQLINSIVGYKSVNLVGTIDQNKRTNLAVVSSVCHLGSNPPLISMIIRPATVPRHTFSNILESKYYTLNQVTVDMVEQAHQTSARYPKDVSEFDATGLTPIFRDGFVAPFVAESPLQLGMSLNEVHHLECNGTEMIIGSVHSISVKEGALGEDGFVDLNKLNAVCASGVDAYYKPELIKRLAYAKPK